MFNAEDVPAVADAADPDHSSASARREFLRRAALAGAGAVGLSLLSSEPADASPPGESLPGTYLINHNFAQHYMGIESQNGTTFTGRFTDGSRFTGTVLGASTGQIVFTRLLADGSTELYVGTLSTRLVAGGKEVVIAGSFYRNDAAPLPWFATGTVPA